MGLPRLHRTPQGFSLPFVILAALMLLVGGLMLALRSSDGRLSTLLQRESNDARDAAETGITRIVGELNRERNRGLMLREGSGEDGDGFLWTQADAASARNPCLGSGSDAANDLADNPSIGFSASPPYADVLLDEEGRVVSEDENPVRAYRLVAVKRVPERTSEASPRPSLRIFEAGGRGTLTLVVEGMSLRNGTVTSRVRLEEQLQVVPKCCDTSFGGAHGPVAYEPDESGSSVCIPEGWGFVAGAAQNDSGSLTLNGNATVVDSSGAVINPLTCIATDEAECDFQPTGTGFTMRTVQPVFNPIPASGVDATAVGTINRNSAIIPGLLTCATATPSATTLKDCPDGAVIFDANATDTPDYCAPFSADAALNRPDGLHCNLEEFDYSQLNIKVINTGQRPLRLFFPTSGDVIRSTGGGSLRHVSGDAADTTPASDATRFSLFGCADCGEQTIQLAGTPEGLAVFAWFPQGDVTLAGVASYQGVVWANGITSNGGVTWTISSSSVASALKLAGFGLAGDDNPPVFDWVARSVRSFRWLGL